jgi:hypothetical protein
LKPNYTVVDIAVNPQMDVLSGQTFIVKHEKKWYEQQWLYAVAGFVTGVVLMR